MKKFCDYCLNEVECTYNEKITEIVVEDKKIKYLKKYYICKNCKHEFLDDLYDYDIETVNSELRKLNNIITTDEIKEITDKYAIGKKPLSLILGIGEVNIIRYLNGSNPTKNISDLLKAILVNPFLYELFLEANKDKITELAYKKSLGKTKQLELNNSKSKLYNTTLYIIKSLKEIDALSIQKILYFAFGFSKKILNKNIFDDLPEAWIYGPVYREIYDSFSYYKGQIIDYDEILKDRSFYLSVEEKEYLDAIIKMFGCYSSSTLIKMTHLTAPWINTRKGLDEKESSNRIITKKEIEDYFSNIYIKYNIQEINDISKYSTKLFKESQNQK